MTEAGSERNVSQWAIQEERDRALAQLALLRADLEAALSSSTPHELIRAALQRPADRADTMAAVYQMALEAVRAHYQPPTPANLRSSQAAWAALDYVAVAADEDIAELVIADRDRRAEAQAGVRAQEPESWGVPGEGEPTGRRPELYDAVVRRWLTVTEDGRSYWHAHRAVELVGGVGGGLNHYGASPKYRLLLREAKLYCCDCGQQLHPRTKECPVHQQPYGWEAVGMFTGPNIEEVCAQASVWLEQSSNEEL